MNKGLREPVIQNASPRLPRWRPVDAVRLAKNELAQSAKLIKPSKFRATELSTDEGSSSVILHDGFYEFAAAVNKPQLSARQQAQQLLEQLEAGLEQLSSRGDANDHRQGGLGLRSREIPRSSLAGSNNPPHVAATTGTSTGSHSKATNDSRNAWASDKLDRAERGQMEVKLCLETLEQHTANVSTDSREQTLLLDRVRQASAHGIEQLSHIVQECIDNLEKSEERNHGLENTLEKLEEDNAGLRHVVQQMLETESKLGSTLANRDEEIALLHQNLEEAHTKANKLNGELSTVNKEVCRLTGMMQTKIPTRDSCQSPMMPFSSFLTVGALGTADIVDNLKSNRFAASSSALHDDTVGRLDASRSMISGCMSGNASDVDNLQLIKNSDRRPSLRLSKPQGLAHCFPEVGQIEERRSQITNSTNHLQAQITTLQEEKEHEIARSANLERLASACLQYFMLWVQALHNTLDNFSDKALNQHVRALAVFQEALCWLVTNPSTEWVNPPGRLETLLGECDCQFRKHLSACPSEMEIASLRSALAEQQELVKDLSQQVMEAHSTMRNMEAIGDARRVSCASFTADVAECDKTVIIGQQDGEDHVAIDSLSKSDSHRPSTTTTTTRLPLRPVTTSAAGSTAVSVTGTCTVEVTSFAGGPDEADDAAGKPVEGVCEKIPLNQTAVATDGDVKRMQLLHSPFTKAIDFTLIPLSGHVFIKPPSDDNRAEGGKDDKHVCMKQLCGFIAEFYAVKKSDDLRRDKAHQPRKPVHIVLQEFMRRQHGVKRVVHQKSWQMVEAVAHYASVDKVVCMFADFLDGTRDLDELSFYLYSSSLFASSISQEANTSLTRLPEGFVSATRATAMIELLYGDLPKAMDVMKAELKKCLVCSTTDMMRCSLSLVYEDLKAITRNNEYVSCVLVEDLYGILLEGWRMMALLFEHSGSTLSWRKCVLAFIQSDVCLRGWLDVNEVNDLKTRLQLVSPPGVEAPECTSLGTFASIVARCSEPRALKGVKATSTSCCRALTPSIMPNIQAAQACLSASQEAFQSLENSLGVCLTWMMHSEELRDLAVYHSIKDRIYCFRRALSASEATQGTHHFRCLLLLLLAHQFDMQIEQAKPCPEHLEWELGCLLTILRENWRRGATAESWPQFGSELDEVGIIRSGK